MAKQVILDTERCIGCEACVELCPDIFAYSESEGKAYVIQSQGGLEECIEEAVSLCPVSCISYE